MDKRKATNINNARILREIIDRNKTKILYLNRKKGLIMFGDIDKEDFDMLRQEPNRFTFEEGSREIGTTFFGSCTVLGASPDGKRYYKATIDIKTECCKNELGEVYEDAKEVFEELDGFLKVLEADPGINTLESVGEGIKGFQEKQFDDFFKNFEQEQ